MDEDKVLDKLIEIVAKVLGVEKKDLSLESKREDFEAWDSLATIVMLMKIEETLGIEFTEEDIKDFDSIKKIFYKITRNGTF